METFAFLCSINEKECSTDHVHNFLLFMENIEQWRYSGTAANTKGLHKSGTSPRERLGSGSTDNIRVRIWFKLWQSSDILDFYEQLFLRKGKLITTANAH
jgi:hypothetical protein